MFENIMKFFKKLNKKEENTTANSRDAAKERLHLVLMQDRANVSADFLELMKQEIIEVIKKYIEVDERAIDVRLTNKENEDGTNGAPALYANIPIVNIKNEARKVQKEEKSKQKNKKESKKESKKEKKEETKAVKNKEEIEESMEESEVVEEAVRALDKTEDMQGIQNERIAKVILESRMYSEENDQKKQSKKKTKKEEVVIDTEKEEQENMIVEQQD